MLEQKIINSVGYKPKNLNRYLELYEAVRLEPFQKVEDYAKTLSWPIKTVYRLVQDLRSWGLIKQNALAVEEPMHELPILEACRKNPLFEQSPIHTLAVYLNKFNDDDKVPGFSKTKKELTEQIVKLLQESIQQVAILGNTYHACVAFLTGNLEPLTRSVGSVEIPTPNQLNEAFHKLGNFTN